MDLFNETHEANSALEMLVLKKLNWEFLMKTVLNMP